MTFGISCAPCIAHYVRDKNAEEYKLQSPRAFEAITKAHYVDDYILVDSLGDETEAIEVTLKVRDIHAAGGFNIRDWASTIAKGTRRSRKSPRYVLGTRFSDLH